MFPYEETGKGIRNMVGSLHAESICKCVIGHRFIRIHIDVATDALLPVGFFQKKENDEENWIQFKYEHLSYFCYKCGALDHMTGWCRFADPVTVTSGNGIVAKIYGLWLRAEHDGNLLFINLSPDCDRRLLPLVEDGVLGEINPFTKNSLLSVSLENCPLEEETTSFSEAEQITGYAEEGQGKESSLEVFLNEVGKSVELKTLNLTFNLQSSGGVMLLQKAVLDRLNRDGFDQREMAVRASKMVSNIAACSVAQRREFSFLGQETLRLMGLSLVFDPRFIPLCSFRLETLFVLNSKFS